MTIVEWVRVGLVPVIVTEYVPVGVEPLVCIVSVDEPDPPLTEVGLKLAVAPLGNPLALNPTVSVNPPEAATLTVYEVLDPTSTVWLDGSAEIEKSGEEVEPTMSVS